MTGRQMRRKSRRGGRATQRSTVAQGGIQGKKDTCFEMSSMESMEGWKEGERQRAREGRDGEGGRGDL